jgi:choline-sulfatase
MSRKPNFLFVQADQLAARALRAYGNKVSKTPNIDKLAERGLVFEHAYCNYPLCAPSRFSMLSGLLPSNAGAYDNGAEFPASMPTFIHYLRLLGYQTCLAGKMHFIGPDQLHGFEERLTTDIYPSDFNWTADWARTVTGTERLLAAAGEVNGILNSGVYERTIQLDFDDEVAFKAIRKIHDLARSDDQRPFSLFVSFTHPHDPFAVPGRYWDRYLHEDIDRPAVAPMPREDLDPHSQRLYDHIGVAEAKMTEADVRVARHAYYGAVSYIDDQLGNLLEALKVAGLADSTIVVFLSDHGEALGERGLWFKRSFFDCALQIPLIVSAPSLFSPSRRDENVSLVDLFPTVIDLARWPKPSPTVAGGGS